MRVRSGNLIDNRLLRVAYLDSGLTACEVCRRLEWFKPNGAPDTTRLQRALGLMPSRSRGYVSFAHRISIRRAELIADALDVAPREVGL